MISLADVPHLEKLSREAMICIRLKQLTKDMKRHDTPERFQRIG